MVTVPQMRRMLGRDLMIAPAVMEKMGEHLLRGGLITTAGRGRIITAGPVEFAAFAIGLVAGRAAQDFTACAAALGEAKLSEVTCHPLGRRAQTWRGHSDGATVPLLPSPLQRLGADHSAHRGLAGLLAEFGLYQDRPLTEKEADQDWFGDICVEFIEGTRHPDTISLEVVLFEEVRGAPTNEYTLVYDAAFSGRDRDLISTSRRLYGDHLHGAARAIAADLYRGAG